MPALNNLIGVTHSKTYCGFSSPTDPAKVQFARLASCTSAGPNLMGRKAALLSACNGELRKTISMLLPNLSSSFVVFFKTSIR